MKQNNKKFNNAMHKSVGVLDKYGVRISHEPLNFFQWLGFVSVTKISFDIA